MPKTVKGKKKLSKEPAATITQPLKKPATVATPITKKKIPNVIQLTKVTGRTLWLHKRLFFMITLTYGFLNLLLVRGFASTTDVSGLKHQFDQLTVGNVGSLVSGLGVFVSLVGSSGNGSSQTAGAYQLFLAVIVSLAIIWALRQVLAGYGLRARDAFYKGMYPLIPFILTLLVVGLQLLPFVVGATIYSTVIANGIAVHAIEKVLWAVVFLLLAAVSLYMLCASLFALYIVTLPDMTPRKALRTASQLVKGRRLIVLRKVLFLPLLLLIVSAVIMVPIIIVITPVAQWIFFILSMFSLVAIHSYMYILYRELLDE